MKKYIKNNWFINKYGEFDKKHSRLSYYLIYTIVFTFLAMIVFSWFYLYGKSFVWIGQDSVGRDGLSQHYNSFAYYGKYLRTIIRGVLSGDGLQIPMWDFSIGQGSDILTTLHYYVIGDPLNLLSVLAPVEQAEKMYGLVAILRIYLAGITFSMYAHKMGADRSGSLMGAISYAFCSYGLYAGIRHVFFANPMIYLPLLFLGIEKIFKKEKPYLYIMMIFISAMSSFYFFYMLGILVLIYAAIRFFFLYRSERLKYFFKWLVRFTIFTITGILLASVIFIPVIISVLGTQRFDIEIMVDLFYNTKYYTGLMKAQVVTGGNSYWAVIGHTSLTLVALVLMFLQRKRYGQLKVAYITAVIILLFPYLGYLMNGFSYVSNRWVFGYAFLMSMILCVMSKEILSMRKRESLQVSGILAVYLVVSLFHRNVRSAEYFIAMIICIAFLAYVLLAGYVIDEKYNTLRVRKTVMFTFMTINICIQAMYLYSPDEGDYISEYQDRGTVYDVMNQTPSTIIKKLEDDTFYRYEADEIGSDRYRHNSALLQEVHTTSYYFSLANGNTSQFLKDFSLENGQGFQYYGLEKRAQLETLANVKYYVIDRQNNSKEDPPYGYEKIGRKDEYDLYENIYALPFGYTYSESISYDTYQNLNPVERQQAAMQAVLIEEHDLLQEREIALEAEDILYTIECDEGIEIEGNKISVRDTSSSIYLLFDEVESCELYLYFEDLYFTPVDPVSKYSEEEWEELSVYERKVSENAAALWRAGDTSMIKGWSANSYSKVRLETPYYSWYKNQHDFLMSFNYKEETRSKIRVRFGEIGDYTFDNIRVITQDMESFSEQVNVLKEDSMEDVAFGTNRVTGTITLDQRKMICMTIPYSDGWIAYVNGEEQEILQVNTMYSGLLLDAGDYEIELVYQTPGIKAGLVCSFAGLVLFLGIIIFYRRKDRKSVKTKG